MQTTAAVSETCLSNSGTKPQTLKLHAKVYPIRAAQGTRLKHIAERNRQLVAAGDAILGRLSYQKGVGTTLKGLQSTGDPHRSKDNRELSCRVIHEMEENCEA